MICIEIAVKIFFLFKTPLIRDFFPLYILIRTGTQNKCNLPNDEFLFLLKSFIFRINLIQLIVFCSIYLNK